MCRFLCECKSLTSLAKYQGAWLLDHVVRECWVLLKKCLSVFPRNCHFAFLEAMNESFIAAHSGQLLRLSVFWTSAILVVCGGISLFLNLHFLDDLWCGVSFQIQILNFHLYIFLEEVSVKVFGSFLSWAICLKVIWVFFFFL